MAADRPRYGPLLSALGAMVLGLAVFLPWYGVSITSSGVAFAQQVYEQVATQFGNATLQSEVGGVHAKLGALTGREITALSAHQALKDLNIVLLVIAALAVLVALASTAGVELFAGERERRPLALLGAIAAVCVLYRIVDPPAPANQLFALSVREGAWLALLGALAIGAGALWPRRLADPDTSEAGVGSALSTLSGWTPEA